MLFDTTAFRVTEQGLATLWEKSKIIEQNLTNEDTPDYKCKYLFFEGILRDKLRANGTVKKELNIGYGVFRDTHTNDQADHNNVDHDTQMAELLKTQYQIDALINQMNGSFSRLRSAMNTK